MKVLFIAGTFPDLTFIYRTVVAIAQRGHDVHVMARDPGNWKAFKHDVPMPPNMRVHYLIPDSSVFSRRNFIRFVAGSVLHIARSPRAAIKLLRMCRAHATTRNQALRQFFRHLPFLNQTADVIQYEFYMLKAIYPLMTDIIPAPYVVSCRGADIHLLLTRTEAEQQWRLEVLRRATAVHCVSDEMAGEVKRLTGRSDGIWVNRPALHVQAIEPKSDYTPDGIPHIVTVGRLHWKKGFDYLLEALRRLKQEDMAFKASIVGDGELFAQMRFSIEDLGLTAEVELTGRLPSGNVFEKLRSADIYVLSSHEEGISNAVLEAMAAGLPVVTTEAGGMAEAVRDGVDGFVVPIRDIPALADRIKRLLLDADLRERMGRSARARVESEFTLERQAQVFEMMYQSICQPEQLEHA